MVKRKKKQVEVRIGTIADLRKGINQVFEDPHSVEKEPERVIYVLPKDLSKILSEERVRLIHELRKGDYTINKLADRLNRKRENVSRDLNILQEYGMVEMQKNGRERHPTTRTQITITL